jgi:hypothetical protein
MKPGGSAEHLLFLQRKRQKGVTHRAACSEKIAQVTSQIQSSSVTAATNDISQASARSHLLTITHLWIAN